MIFSLDIRRARKGDCLILHYGSKSEPGLVVIDGGPDKVYKPQLKPRLMQIKQMRNLVGDASLPIDLLMVSHIDEDHIQGILEMTNELVVAADSQKPLPFKIRNLWHNSFDDIIGNSPDELRAAVTASFGAAALSGESDTEGLEPTAAKVLASVPQGFRLRDDARRLKLPVNSLFDEKLIMSIPKGKSVDIGKGLKFVVAGPMKAELLDLQKEHDAFLKKKESEKKEKAALASFTDNSVPNLSSLVLLAKVGKKRMLLTGDARGDKILEGLELVGLLKKDGKMHVEILKMPHHGSDRNMDPIFFRRITADHYVFSGNGENGNPERATLQMLLDERGDEQFSIHLTYPIEEIDTNRKKDWETEQKKEKTKHKKNKNIKVRENWSSEKQSLSSFFAAHGAFAKKLRIVDEGVPYVIDLLDKIDF